ncbi:unnamed protein product, partial [Lymnaea stagnalis]
MIRWLKDKKKEKKTSSTSTVEDDDGKEDDYGFDKDKQASKSPSSRRQLPPTPAAPEEKSPHIYEEIPDLFCLLDREKSALGGKGGKGRSASKPGKAGQVAGSGYNVPSTEKSGDDINPYMVVPVDKEVRQTPTNFHRNGTPEVHCDVIVKDTHCEILLTRKPKVSAFRLDDAATSTGGGGESSSGRYGLRNNTHFCSRDRRASVDVHSAGKLSTGFSASSSAFSSSSRLPSASQSASNFSDLQPFESIQENDCGATGANGVVTYSSASNFIARATKLAFHPLGGKDPRKEAFGSDSSDGTQAAAYLTVRDDDSSVCTQGVSYASVQDICAPSKCTTYASLLDQNTSAACNMSGTKTVTDNPNGDWSSKQSTYRQGEIETPFSAKQHDCCVSPSDDNFQIRTGVIRSTSPSYSSSCTYASVTFPAEAKVYNTISDLTPSGFSDNARKGHNGGKEESTSFHCRYSRETKDSSLGQYCDARTNGTYSDINTFRANDPRKINGMLSNCGLQGNRVGLILQNKENLHSGDSTYVKNQIYASIDCDSNASRGSSFHMSQIRNRRSIDLDFCSCSDEHSSSCGCTDVKTDNDDDGSSVAGAAAAAEGPNSCKGCGRIIRQITYSESFSDETYEHVYASRLLIRTGRRFSSPDITFLESANSEFHTRPHSRSPESLQSRDDIWAISRSDDTLPPAYGACDDNGFVSSYSEVMSLKRRDSDVSSCRSPFSHLKTSSAAGVDKNPRFFTRQNTSPVSNHSSMFCGTRATIGSSSIFSAGRSRHFENITRSDSRIEASVDQSIESQSRLLGNMNNSTMNEGCDQDRVAEASKTLQAVVEPKANALSGIFAKLTRQKSSKTARSDLSENCAVTPHSVHPLFENELSVDRNSQRENETQDSNVKKFSKFFQRISNKEMVRASTEDTIPMKIDVDTDKLEQTVMENPFLFFQESSLQLSCECPNQLFKELKNSLSLRHSSDGALHSCRDTSGQIHPVQSLPKLSCFSLAAEGSADGHEVASKIVDLTARPCTNVFDLACQTIGLAGNKTDSGDTCYEYDISTSSEGEQAGYDYFLSKVEKTLNLEQEAQHIADGSVSRRKLLCKRCKRDENYSKIDSIEEGASGSSYGFCPHLSAKFGDLRAIFDDLVVDQRAAILDCLTDYAHSPYNVKGNNHENHCRECGCEIVTSDSESLTTVYSLLSQQLALTSPNARTPSCESDEGTMADNSCESADEANVENQQAREKQGDYDERNSSGYDEPDAGRAERAPIKARKRDKKDKKSTPITVVTSVSLKEEDKRKIKSPQGHRNLTSGEGVHHGRLNSDSGLSKHSLCHVSESLGSSSQKTKHKKTGVFAPNYESLETKGLPETEVNHAKICPASRRRPGLISDKALQDIYAPLPSKALSLLTSRNYGPNTGGSCTCGRENQASSTAMAALLATVDPPPPPTVTVKESNTVNPSPCPPLLDANNGDGVSSVQTHSEHKKQGEIASLEFNFHKGGIHVDGGKGERWKMDANVDNEITVKGAVESTWMINAPVVNKRTNDGAHSPTKCAEAVSDNFILPHSVLKKTSRDTGRLEVAERCAGNNRDTVAQRGRKDKRETGDKDSETPQTGCRGTRETNEPSTRSSVEDLGKKIKLTRRHRLEMATLDLLPETALCGDADSEVGASVQSNVVAVNKTKRSSVVEKMMKIFEDRAQNKEDVMSIPRRKCTEEVGADTSKPRLHRSRSRDLSGTYRDSSSTHRDISKNHRDSNSAHRDSSSKHRDPSSTRMNSNTNEGDPCFVVSPIKGNLKPTLAESSKKKPVVGELKTSPQDLTDRGRPTAAGNLCDISESANLNLNEMSTGEDTVDPLPVRSRTPGSDSRLKNTGSFLRPPDGTRIKNKPREGKVLSGHSVKSRSSALHISEASGRKVKSPTPSMSSSSTASSTSSPSKRKGNARHKKLHKKSSDKKRSKSRRANNGKGERTRYYFSSDLSDIDVVEVDDWETYANKLAPSPKTLHRSIDSTQSPSPYGSMTNASARIDDVNSSSSHSRENQEAEFELYKEAYEQEIYAIPP